MQKGIHFLINLKAFKYLEPENLTERNEMEQVQVKNLLVKQLDYTNNSILWNMLTMQPDLIIKSIFGIEGQQVFHNA